MDFCRNWNVKEEVWFYKCSLFGIRNSFVCKFVLMDNENTVVKSLDLNWNEVLILVLMDNVNTDVPKNVKECLFVLILVLMDNVNTTGWSFF